MALIVTMTPINPKSLYISEKKVTNNVMLKMVMTEKPIVVSKANHRA